MLSIPTLVLPLPQSIDQVKHLKYNDQELRRLFREADKDFKRGVDYEQLLTGGEDAAGEIHRPLD